MVEIEMNRKLKRIIGIALVIVGLTIFFMSYYSGVVGQKIYSNQGCAVDSRPNTCTISNDQIVVGFVGMIFSFFGILGGIALIISGLWATKKSIRGGGKRYLES